MKEYKEGYRNMKIKIRKIKPGDEAIVSRIQIESWKSAFAGILSQKELERNTDFENVKSMYENVLKKDLAQGWILLIDDEPHCIAFWGKSREVDLSDYAELICIHSLQNRWSKGYGSMMLEKILDEMRMAGYKNAMLWVFKENNRARKFYEKHGFRISDKIKQLGDAFEVMYYKKL